MVKINPTYKEVSVNDEYVSHLSTWNGRSWFKISRVLKVEPKSTRFGKPDKIVHVEIRTNEGRVTDTSKPIWVSQLLQGLT